MDKKEIIKSLDFGSDVAEHEINELAKYFVETDQWFKIYNGQIDIIYGSKGAGKSAIYHLIVSKEEDLFDKNILLAPAENPREDPAFSEIRAELPPTEVEFTGLWKLYLCSVAALKIVESGIENRQIKEVIAFLEGAGVIEPNRKMSLNSIVKMVSEYVTRLFRPKDVSTEAHFDPVSGGLTGITGKISFSEPNMEARRRGVRPIREILQALDQSLAEFDRTIWLLLDRLDVAFAENEEVENRALRALFNAYKDMSNLEHVKIKLFIRSDIWDRITEAGYREATHAASPEKSEFLIWNYDQLFNVFIKRIIQSEKLCEDFRISRDDIKNNIEMQNSFVSRIFPDKVDTGKNPKTFAWIYGRLQDGLEQATPRELIQFFSALRKEQLGKLEKGVPPPPDELLFERSSFKAALRPVSDRRLTTTIYAEYSRFKKWIEALRGRKSQQSPETLSAIWGVDDGQASVIANNLHKIGVFRRYQTAHGPMYEIPILYRSALQIVRGAEMGLRQDSRPAIGNMAYDDDDSGDDENHNVES